MNDKQVNRIEAESLMDIQEKIPKESPCSIKKPLIPLKAALFLWFGSSSSVYPFVIVYFKQIGLSVSQLSTIYIALPPVQFLFPVVAGIVADKIGRAKPVLVFTMLLVMLLLNCMLLVPQINVSNCPTKEIQLTCDPIINVLKGADICNFSKPHFVVNKCWNDCEGQISDVNDCADLDYTFCKSSENLINSFTSFNVSVNASDTNSLTHDCKALIHQYLKCGNSKWKNCALKCSYEFVDTEAEEKEFLNCDVVEDNTSFVFIISLILIVLYHSLLSTCFHILDVTSMYMVKAHDSDFGRERFWSISGSMVFSTFSGYLVGRTSEVGGPKNISTAIYLSDGVLILALIAITMLDVQIKKPGIAMWEKSVALLKNIDVIAFLLVVLTLGMCWAFVQFFTSLYLDGLGASGLLLGLDNAVKNLYGLPFLLTSNFWVRKIGSVNLLVLGFVGYMVVCLGYFFMINPWYSLLNQMTAIFTYHLLWVAVVRHSHDLAPEGLTATVISAAGALHFGIGKGTGSLVGGLTMGKFGHRAAYRLMGCIAAVAGLLYASFLIIRKKCSKARS